MTFLFQKGEIKPVSVSVGDKVMLPEYGGTKVILEDQVDTGKSRKFRQPK